MTLLEKLANIQAELKVPKSQYNEFGKYNFRNCEDILEAVKPLCKKYKTALILTDEVVKIGERYYVKARAMLNDLEGEGESMIDVFAYAREEERKSGMDGSQITGSSSSYARKYALNGLFNIDDTKDSDTTNKGEIGNQAAKTGRRDNAHGQPPAQTRTPQPQAGDHGSGMTLKEAFAYSMKKGKHANVNFGNVPMDYLKWVAENLSGRAQEAARLVIQSVNANDDGQEAQEGKGQPAQMDVFDDDGDIPF